MNCSVCGQQSGCLNYERFVAGREMVYTAFGCYMPRAQVFCPTSWCTVTVYPYDVALSGTGWLCVISTANELKQESIGDDPV